MLSIYKQHVTQTNQVLKVALWLPTLVFFNSSINTKLTIRRSDFHIQNVV